MLHALLIDDDLPFLESLTTVLKSRARITCASQKNQFVEAFLEHNFDFVVTDFRMNFWDGFEVVEFIRKVKPNLPIIIVSGFVDKSMAIRAANLHVHRILEKPLDLLSLYAAVDNLNEMLPVKIATVYRYGDIVLNDHNFVADVNREKISLTETEYNILKIMIENVDCRVERTTFHELLWKDTKVAPNVLDTHLLNLKKKLPSLKEKLVNVRGRGYLLPALVESSNG